jgi:hypothetical protein
MSDRNNAPPALPGAGGDQGAGNPQTTPLRDGRKFAPSFQRSYRNDGLTESGALAKLRERRGVDPGGADPGAGGGAGGAPALRQRPSGPVLPAEPPAAVPFSPLTGILDEPAPGLPTPAPGPTPGPAPAGGGLAPAPPVPGDPIFNLTIGGQPQQIALSELIRGYMRHSDYTTKSQQNAAQLRQAQDAVVAFTKAREALEAKLPSIIASYAGEFDKPIDWVKLASEDPIGYAQKDARFKQYQAAVTEAAQLKDMREREDFNRKQEMRRLGHDFLMAVLPGWRDPATRQQLQLLQTQHLRAVGFTPEEIEQTELLDPRYIIILEESRRFRALVGAHPELLRAGGMRPVPPVRRGDMPQPLPGNGRFERQPAAAVDAGDAERRWQELPSRSGAGARDAAVSLIAARRRATTSGANPMAPLRTRRG